MVEIVEIQFQKNGRKIEYIVEGLDVVPGDYVIADTPRGMDLGMVASEKRETDEESLQGQIRKLIRKATEQDLLRSTDNRNREREAYAICQKKITEHQLDMKLVSVEYAFDNSKAIFYFTANGRVDFRSLVKDLASVFKMRIELRQIGVRDEARMLGGLGPCGRPICCGTFLNDFQPVSIKMAKEQNLSLNPTKISGVCGRLMCCLKYEQDHYEQTRKRMPRLGKEVGTPDGKGIVTDLNIVKETVFVRIANGDANEIKEYPLEKVEKLYGPGSAATAAPAVETEEEIIAEEPEIEELNEEIIGTSQEQEEEPQPRQMKPARNNRGKGNPRPRDNRKNEKSEQPRKEPHQLGKPVMRENPNRTVAAAQNPAPQNAVSAENKPATKQKTSWADAVQKAMESIN